MKRLNYFRKIDLIKKCKHLVKLKGVKALRLNSLMKIN